MKKEEERRSVGHRACDVERALEVFQMAPFFSPGGHV